MRVVVILALVSSACSSVVPGHHEPWQTLDPGPCAVDGVTGTLPGVTLAIRSASCVYAQGELAHFTYEVTTDASVPGISTPASAGCGSCQLHSTDPASWVRWGIGGMAPGGNYQSYCICDTGCCPPESAETIQPVVATETVTIDWDGRTWDGPSDTDTAEGPYFEPGVYAVTVSFAGYSSGSVEARLPIEVVP